MRIFLRGGNWSNSEDEVLKLLVMKYGFNQWSRIASLLHRKSAKQCKARWFEWLDPSIKKTEWSREEEEKLLHLAKLMPTQWRTIAPIVGRTAAQCLEHYEKLIDAAQAASGEGSSTDGPRTLKPGEVDPHPESRPAKPDAIDMAEDEKEMLMEARARLANTQGKKAKRKAREKSLEEAHRLAGLQKRKELRAAGLETGAKRKKKRKRGIDYNAEIPLEKRPSAGFYDTSQEDHEFREIKRSKKFEAIDMSSLNPVDRDAEEAKARKLDQEKQAKRKAENAPDHILQIQKQHNLGEAVRERTKLVLPKPQVSNEEIRDIVKLGQTSDAALSFVEEGASVSKGLLQDYSLTQGLTPQRTAPSGGAKTDSILMAAQNLIAINETQTPLAGGMNTPLHDIDTKVQATPNTVLATPLRQAGIPGGMTPQRGQAKKTPGATPGATPLRDSLSINMGGTPGGTPLEGRRERQRQSMLKRQLREGLLGLPAPQNDLELQLPEADDDAAEDDDCGPQREVDQSDVDKARRNRTREQEEAELRLQSSVIRKSLPRPLQVFIPDAEVSEEMDDIQKADAMIHEQMRSMMQRDAFDFPIAGARRPQSRTEIGDVTESEVLAAQNLLDDEMKAMGIDGDQLLTSFTTATEQERAASIYLNHEKRLAWRVRTSDVDIAKAGELTFQALKKKMDEGHKLAKKLEKKIDRLTKGYQTRAATLSKDVVNRYVQLSHANCELECFRYLQHMENLAIPARKETLEREVSKLRARENKLQREYAQVVASRNTASAPPIIAN